MVSIETAIENAASVVNERQDSLVRRWFIDHSTLANQSWLLPRALTQFRCSKSSVPSPRFSLNGVIQIIDKMEVFNISKLFF